jgi:hypothetical protein
MNDQERACRGLALPSENNADAPTLFDPPKGMDVSSSEHSLGAASRKVGRRNG